MRLILFVIAVALVAITPARGEEAGEAREAQQTKLSGDRTKGSKLPAGFVRLTDVAPDIIEDIRYGTPQNFTGRRVAGYRAGRCILARPVAQALARVQRAVKRDGYGIKVYDCYRPIRAVRAFVRWAEGGTRGDVTKFYYPRIARDRIIPLGYVGEHSSHSRGVALDLTLVRLGKATPVEILKSKETPARGASCISQKPRRPVDNSIDMGTAWDCFDVLSHTRHANISATAKANRQRLLSAMQAVGFRNYKREWWHFSWPVKGYYRAHDFPVD